MWIRLHRRGGAAESTCDVRSWKTREGPIQMLRHQVAIFCYQKTFALG